VVAELTPLPLAKVTDEGIPIEGNPIKVLPLTSETEMGGQKENLNSTDELVCAVTSSQEQISLSVTNKQTTLRMLNKLLK
jgi:hypothetical protein